MRTGPALGAPYGWRARIGFVTPSGVHENNEFEFYLMAPEGVTIATTSLGVSSLQQDEYDKAVARMETAVEQVVDRGVDAIVQAGVPLTVTHGWGSEDKLRERVKKVTPLPFATDIGACISAMQTLGMSRVAMVTPFDDKLHNDLTQYVAHAGITVVGARSIVAGLPGGVFRGAAVSTVALGVPYRTAKDLFYSLDNVNGVWITGALMPSVAIIEALEEDLGVPVISSMQAMMWASLGLTHVRTKVEGYGQLFEHEWPQTK